MSRRGRASRWGAILPTCLLLAVVAGAPAAGAATLQKGFWGPTVLPSGASAFPLYKQLGVTVFQTQLSWAATAPTRPANPGDPADPAYQWPASIDDTIAQGRTNGMKTLILVSQTPPWANGGKTPEWAPDKPADYADFVRAASKRYPAVRLWMIWGEPSRSNNWKPLVQQPLGDGITPAERVAPRRYARLLDAAYGALKSVSHANTVIGGNTYVTGEVRPGDWVRNMRLPDGRPPRMDLYGHNPFTDREPNLHNPQSGSGLVDFSDLGRFDKLVQQVLGRPRHKRVRLWLSEFTIPTGVDSEFNFHTDLKTQAKWITSAFRVARQVHAAGLGWIHLYDIQNDSQGGLIDRSGMRKPGFYAFMRGGLTAAQRARERAR